MTCTTFRVIPVLAAAAVLGAATAAAASDVPSGAQQDGKAAAAAAPTAPAAQEAGEDDAVLKPAEPDFTLIGLPTSLNMPKYKSVVRITHRFRQQFGSNDFFANFFGIDSGAQIGLEYRFGLIPRGQVGIQRTSERTVEFFGEYGLTRQRGRMPFETAVWLSIDGTNNFRDSHTPAVGAIVSRAVAQHVALYIEPLYVNNSNPLPKQLVDHNDTFMLGIGGRFRILSTVYIVAETAPRLRGYKPGVNYGSVAIEKRVGGHMFQLNFSNSFATTMGQLATSNHAPPGPRPDNWYMGFNITRKFF